MIYLQKFQVHLKENEIPDMCSPDNLLPLCPCFQDKSQQRSGKKFLVVLTQISSFKVQTDFRHDFKTAAATGLINAFLPSTWVTQIMYPSAVVVISCCNYEKGYEVSAPSYPINWKPAVFACTLVAINWLEWGCCSGNIGMWSSEPEVMQMFTSGRHWGATAVAQVLHFQ